MFVKEYSFVKIADPHRCLWSHWYVWLCVGISKISDLKNVHSEQQPVSLDPPVGEEEDTVL